MRIPARRGVSPIIATLLLIAIAVAAGIIVYVFVGGLSGNLTKSGGNQVTEQISLNAYTFDIATSNLTVSLMNTGSGSVSISQFYIEGSPVNAGGTNACAAAPLAPGAACTTFFTPITGTAGQSVSFKIVTTDGAQFTYNVVAGSSG